MATITIKKEYNFDDLYNNSWSGALYTLKEISRQDKEDELMYLIQESFSDIPTDTEVNDFLWFEDEFIFEQLGIKNAYEEETESEEEEE